MTFKPDGWPTVIPRIVTGDVAGLAAFMRRVFDAQGEVHANRPAEMRIGESLIMVSSGGFAREAQPAFLYVYVEDTDTTFSKAMEAGALSIESPFDTPYGDRRATLRDKWGNFWQLATRR